MPLRNDQPMACFFCGLIFEEHEMQTRVGDVPAPGDYSVCGRCARIGVYDPGVPFQIRKPLMAELFDLFNQPYWPAMRDRIRCRCRACSGVGNSSVGSSALLKKWTDVRRPPTPAV